MRQRIAITSASDTFTAWQREEVIDELLIYLTPYVGEVDEPLYQSTWVRRKMGKLVVGFRSSRIEANGSAQEYVAKVYRNEQGKNGFAAMNQLWHAGFQPPSMFTVVQPIAYIAEKRILLQEKAPGRQLESILFETPSNAAPALIHTARWLAKLHQMQIESLSWIEHHILRQVRYGKELVNALPEYATRIEQLVERILTGLETDQLTPLHPSHGDFHADNIFIDEDGRVTIIDLDTFGLQERAADVAYFLAQTAIMGYFHQGSFAVTTATRRLFLQAYHRYASSPPESRLALYVAMAFLQSLHYELCVLKTNNLSIIPLWIHTAESCLHTGTTLIANE